MSAAVLDTGVSEVRRTDTDLELIEMRSSLHAYDSVRRWGASRCPQQRSFLSWNRRQQIQLESGEGEAEMSWRGTGITSFTI